MPTSRLSRVLYGLAAARILSYYDYPADTANRVGWPWVGSICAGQPPLPTRLAILKYTHDLSDEVLCERWVENPCQRMGEEKLAALIQESLSVTTRTDTIKPSELSWVIVDTTVQPKNVMVPTDAKLLNRAREFLVRQARKHSVDLRQSYSRVGKFALIKHQRYAHAKQWGRANRSLKKLKPIWAASFAISPPYLVRSATSAT
jgi:hypothetical protein